MVVLTLIFPFIFQKSFWKAGVGLGALDGWPIYQWQQTYGGYRSAEGGHIQGPGADGGPCCTRLPLPTADPCQRQEGWGHHPYPSQWSRQGRDQRRIWGTNGECAMLITIRNMGARGGSTSWVAGSSNSYKPITNSAWINYKKGCTRLAATFDQVYQLLAHGRWFSPASSRKSTRVLQWLLYLYGWCTISILSWYYMHWCF